MDYTKIMGHLDGLMAYYSFTDPSIKMSQTLKEMAARREEQARLVAERKQKEQVPPGASPGEQDMLMEEILHHRKDGWNPINSGINHQLVQDIWKIHRGFEKNWGS